MNKNKYPDLSNETPAAPGPLPGLVINGITLNTGEQDITVGADTAAIGMSVECSFTDGLNMYAADGLLLPDGSALQAVNSMIIGFCQITPSAGMLVNGSVVNPLDESAVLYGYICIIPAGGGD